MVSGGQATAGPPLGPTLGPLGLNVLAVVKKINELTESYAGMKVPVKIEVDLNTKMFEVDVGVPTMAALIVKELGISKGSGTPNTEKIGNLTMEQIIQIANKKHSSLLAKNLKSAVKEVLGSCLSMGVTVEDREIKIIQEEIDQGEYDVLLKEAAP